MLSGIEGVIDDTESSVSVRACRRPAGVEVDDEDEAPGGTTVRDELAGLSFSPLSPLPLSAGECGGIIPLGDGEPLPTLPFPFPDVGGSSINESTLVLPNEPGAINGEPPPLIDDLRACAACLNAAAVTF